MSFIVQGFGDLPTKAPFIFGTPQVFNSFDSALDWIKNNIQFDNDDILSTCWFDPEDDRIVIYDASVQSGDRRLKAVWHASGWHWPFDASDLYGGPLDQGKLPGYTKTVYELATEEY